MLIKHELSNAYLNNQISIYDLIVKLDIEQNKDIKGKGVIYTPFDIVEHMITLSELSPDDYIIEPSCGHGVFIFGILDYIAPKLSNINLLDWFIEHVSGYDISKNAIDGLKELLVLYFKKHNINTNLKSFTNLYLEDSLFAQHKKQYTLCVGNPPYVRTKNIDIDYLTKIRTHFKSCQKGNIDLYYAFIEKASKISKRTLFITPNGFLNNKSGAMVKNIVFEGLNTLIDFKEKLIFNDARTYTCIFYTKDKSLSYEYSENLNDPKIMKNKKVLPVGSNNNFQVLSGIATLCDSVFKVKKVDNLYYATFNDQEYEIEKEMVVPYLKITKLSQNGFMIYPYDEQAKIIDDTTIKTKYPKTYRYLNAVQNILNSRDKGKGKYESWYAYGRKQGLHHIVEDKALVFPQMIGGDCLPKILDLKEIKAGFKSFVFTSGYVIPFNTQNKKLIEFIDSKLFNGKLKEIGKPYPGKDEPYYNLTATQLKNIV